MVQVLAYNGAFGAIERLIRYETMQALPVATLLRKEMCSMVIPFSPSLITRDQCMTPRDKGGQNVVLG